MRFVIFDIAATLQFNVYHTHWLCCTPRLLFIVFLSVLRTSSSYGIPQRGWYIHNHKQYWYMWLLRALFFMNKQIRISANGLFMFQFLYRRWFRFLICLYHVGDKSRRMFDYSLSGIFHHIMFNWIEFHNDRMMHISNWIKSLLVFECTVFKLHVFPFYVEKFRFLFSIFRQCFNVLQC